MSHRPKIGTIGRTCSALSPDGQADFAGTSFQVRVEEANIGSDRPVIVTGFNPWSLIVREATAEEIALDAKPVAPVKPDIVRIAGLVLGISIFVSLVILGTFFSLGIGGLAGFGFFLAMVGRMWLLVLIVRNCPPNAIVMALYIPFFTWFFAWQRWDVATWPVLLYVLGCAVFVLGILISF
jgi:hypothetical protein